METAASPAQHIESIRADFRGLPARPRESLQNALDHLGAKLYSRKTHFLLELIQNADDNHYEAGVDPELVFELLSVDPTDTPDAEGCLLVGNNERGFEPEHVDAICRLGKTTKSKAAGYIGEKGVGFKSVFQVSGRPHIVSNGYAFSFNEKPSDGTVGYICPAWLEHPPAVMSSWATRILLPLKKGELSRLRDELAGIHPSILLFLQKLKRLRVTFDGKPLQELALEPRTAGLGPLTLVRLTATARSSTRYWVYRHVAHRPEGVEEQEREGVDESVITIAFSLDEQADEEGRVFVFLPTELRSGFPFIVNVDFLTTPSRESILFDRSWNRWLRDELSIALAEGLLALARLVESPPNVRPDEPGPEPNLPYTFMPDPGRVREREFFLKVWDGARARLRSQAFVRSATSDPGHYQLRTPPEVLQAGEDLRGLLFPDNDPCPGLGVALHLVHGSLAGVGKALDRLGSRQLSFKDLAHAIESPWLARRSPRWFVDFYSYLASKKWRPPAEFPLIPTTSGLANAEDVVYFASAKQEVLPPALAQRFRLRVITAELSAALDESPTALKWLREECGVSELSPVEVIVKSILPEISASDSVGLIIEATRYIARHWEQLPDAGRKMVTAELPHIVATEAKDEASTLVLPSGLDPEGWQLVFPEPEDRLHLTVLSDDYIRVPKDELPRVVAVLRAVEATDTPPPRRMTTRGDPGMDEFEHRLWAEVGYSTRVTTVTNYRPPRWLGQLKAGDDPEEALPRIRALLGWLQRWEERRQTHGTYAWPLAWEQACVEWFYYSPHSKTTESEIVSALRKAPWIPSTRGLQPPESVFVDSEEVRQLFSDDVQYLSDLADEFVGVLARYGVNQSATPAAALRYVRARSQAGADIPRTAADALYRLVAASDQRQEPAPGETLVYVPDAEPKWRSTTEVTWSDTAAALEERFPCIERIYPKLRDLFVTRWKVPDDAPDEAYLTAWRELPARRYPPERVELALERIYPRLKTVARQRLKAFEDLPIWTQDGRFADRPVYVPDDPDLRSRFAGVVSYAWRPAKRSFEDFAELYDALGVRSLKRSVVRTVVHTDCDSATGPRLLTLGARRMLAYDLSNRWSDCWDEKQEAVVALLRLEELEFNRLVVRYELVGERSIDVDDLVVCADRGRLLVAMRADIEEVRQATAALLANETLDTNDRDVENAVFRALTVKDEWASKEIRRKRLRRPPNDVLQGADQLGLLLASEDSEGPRPDRASHSAGGKSPIEEVAAAAPEPAAPATTVELAQTPRPAARADVAVEAGAAQGDGPTGTPSPQVGQTVKLGADAAGQPSGSGDGALESVAPPRADAGAPGIRSVGVRRAGESPSSFAGWILGLQRSAAPQRQVEELAPAGGPGTVRAAEEDLERARGVPDGSRVEVRVRRAHVLTDVASALRDRARAMLDTDYAGRCQICGRTFVQGNGDFDVVVVQWRPAVSESGDIHYGNLLGLCAWHAALMQRGRFALLDAQSRPFHDEASLRAFVRDEGVREETTDAVAVVCLPIRFHNVAQPGESETSDHDDRIRYCPPHWEFFRRLVDERPSP